MDNNVVVMVNILKVKGIGDSAYQKSLEGGPHGLFGCMQGRQAATRACNVGMEHI